jgi:hypothetical protein
MPAASKKKPTRTAPVPARKRPAPARAAAPEPRPLDVPAPMPKVAKTRTAAAAAEAVKPSDGGDKASKARKPKLVRDSFTIPKDEYAAIDTLKERAARGGRPAKKSELLRAGLQLLARLDDAAFTAAVAAVPAVKTGRPAKG